MTPTDHRGFLLGCRTCLQSLFSIATIYYMQQKLYILKQTTSTPLKKLGVTTRVAFKKCFLPVSKIFFSLFTEFILC